MEEVFFVGSIEPVVRELRQQPVAKATEHHPEADHDEHHDPDEKERVQDDPYDSIKLVGRHVIPYFK